ncbi:MAG: hypothetical protein US86_C0001G0036 [Candidatus Daviesbacteria bacterium GW2011_GWA2_38_24]|uniref:NadR/Ttd14 AAA domain-containing protein n=1 Tax=Candidatus Daviesbacteria bacterium GW2011_GWA2_38_24 TaxID=1618422 RepID=A0A0G0M0F1_9BACT|nr:MAG: hypothetical protein US86_C0001G0036 [Candidatus Daviesbacteria bacterium GW2011_GWA2_38_24]OGE22785.1 MAG: hypothetical protein A2688_00835 [Candidatus Daviesbacteria bacterium RIFCSPHIGHO2_01_FULL_38_8]
MAERENPMKVTFVGTSCIGKTTLLDEYRTKFNGNPRVNIVDEAARIYFTQNPGTSNRFGKEAQGSVQALALQQEQAAHESKAEVILCDRSVIDAVVYVKASGDQEGALELLDRVKFWLPTYNKFLLLNPTDVPYQTDEVRQESEQVRQGFHNAYLEFFEESGIPYELLSGTLEQRVERVDEILSEKI